MKRAVVVLPGTQVSPPSFQEESTVAVARDVDAEVVALREDAEVVVPREGAEVVAPREGAEVAVPGGVDGNMLIINL